MCPGDLEHRAFPLLSPPQHRATATGKETPLHPRKSCIFLGAQAAERLRALRPGGEGGEPGAHTQPRGLQRIFLQNRDAHTHAELSRREALPGLRPCSAAEPALPRSSPLSPVRAGWAGRRGLGDGHGGGGGAAVGAGRRPLGGSTALPRAR